MIDGCPEGWVGSIPVCVLSGAAQQEYSSAAKDPSRDGTLVKERDYISLGLAAPAQEQVYSSTPTAELEKMECDNVVLSLGLGPPDKAAAQADASPLEQPHAQLADTQPKSKVNSSGSKSQHFWHEDFRVSLNSEHNQFMANWPGDASSHGASSLGKSYTSSIPAWSPAVPARFAVPVPKVSTIPAKRPYQDTNAERRSTSVQGELVPHSVMPSSAGVYAWSNDPFGANPSVGGVWQQVHVKFEQAVSSQFHGNGMNAVFGHSPRQLPAPLPAVSNFKAPQAAAAGISMPPPSSASGAATGAPSSSQAANVLVNHEADHESSRNKAPVVGWPPVRSFRKNTLQAAHTSSRMSTEDLPTKGMGGLSSTSDALEHISGNNNKNAFFVKAKLDGVRICRKVDLTAYNSYEGLKGALQEMFQGFVSDNAKLDILNGNNYVVTHEDKDGDCLLVGDVPWHMFLESSVKSLRIMKAKDAIGIGEKGSAKLKAHDANGKPS